MDGLMAALLNPKHELFAQALAKGETAVAAYEQAGYPLDPGLPLLPGPAP